MGFGEIKLLVHNQVNGTLTMGITNAQGKLLSANNGLTIIVNNWWLLVLNELLIIIAPFPKSCHFALFKFKFHVIQRRK